MGQRLIIESLEVRTAAASESYSFGPGVNAVTGPLGSGKSSMLELIKYGLGGSAKVMPAVRDNVELIVLCVQAGQHRWQLTRRLRDPLVDVLDLITGEPLGTWATTNRQNMRLLKVELQRALGLPTNWRVPTSRRKPTDKTMPIGFGDVYRYLYLDQEGIDSSVIRHTDNNLNNKRIAVFELLYGLASMRTVELARLRGERVEEAAAQRRKATAVAQFLRDLGEPDVQAIAASRARLAEQVELAQERLEEARNAASRNLVPRSSIALVSETRSRLEDATSRRDALQTSIDEARGVVAQLQIEESRLKRATSFTSLRLELSENSTKIDDLSDLFEQILGSLNDPWFNEAHVDKTDYLPVVDGEKFDMLSVAGARKTLVNLAYHLANLSMSISERTEMLLPTLLIVDSPRKNVGNSALDRSVVEAIYARLRTLQGASPGQFQIIFADNDMPASASKWVTSHIAMDYDHPFVPGVVHRGEEEEPIGNAATEIE